MNSKTRQAYKQSTSFYDDVLTRNNWWGKLYIDFFWGIDDLEIAEELLGWIPNDHDGKLLDVPVGTGVFTKKKYQQMNQAEIHALDYSKDMLEIAKKRFDTVGIEHILFHEGDVGCLEFEDEYFDIVLSMNGFHAFPDKIKAFNETARVLKKGGKFIAVFYVKRENKRSDFVVKQVLSRKGWFSPPFHTKEDVYQILKKRYDRVDIIMKESMLMAHCIK